MKRVNPRVASLALLALLLTTMLGMRLLSAEDPDPSSSSSTSSDLRAPGDTEPRMDPPPLKAWRKPPLAAWDRSRDRLPDAGQPIDDPVPTLANPFDASRLENCAEYTKPDSLKFHLTGTPLNRRSPPV